MKLVDTNFQGVKLFEMTPFRDERGFFARNFCCEVMENSSANREVSQANLSFNSKKGTIRGFHFQFPPYQEAKTVTVIQGSVHYKIIDIRPDSPTYLSVSEYELEPLAHVIQVPQGCAPAFQTLVDNTLLHYYVSQSYNSDFEDGIRFNDPQFNFSWPINTSIISERDKSFKDFNRNSYELDYYSRLN
jgi:dTDP-4-dehydrorhamnose 3,5-epimerase